MLRPPASLCDRPGCPGWGCPGWLPLPSLPLPRAAPWETMEARFLQALPLFPPVPLLPCAAAWEVRATHLPWSAAPIRPLLLLPPQPEVVMEAAVVAAGSALRPSRLLLGLPPDPLMPLALPLRARRKRPVRH